VVGLVEVSRSAPRGLTRLIGLLAAALIAGVVLGGANTAHAALSDGQIFPCTDNFAKRVAIASGFAERARESNSNYRDPRFWEATQTVCADFDQDGNDEMVFALSAMGGTNPWAFFDVPNGNAAESFFSFPTVGEGGLYPNHALELVRVDGVPAIRDKRRLFRHRDAHCCPTGGALIRVVGFREGSYTVIDSFRRRPPGLHKARLSVDAARTAVARFLGRRYGAAWYERAGGRLICNRRLAFNVRKCEIGFVIGDTGYFGPVRIALLERESGDRHARIRYRISRLNEYCVFALHKPPALCTKVDRGSTQLRF
jgi:hypothetical protein